MYTTHCSSVSTTYVTFKHCTVQSVSETANLTIFQITQKYIKFVAKCTNIITQHINHYLKQTEHEEA
jgi:hypothetical protein